MKKILAIIFLIFFFQNCSYKPINDSIGIERNTGFIELPFPSNNYMPGQIIEVYTRPNKVDITFQSNIGWDQLDSSPGWNISSTQVKEVTRNLSTGIAEVLSASYDYASEENVQVNFTNTKTYIIEKFTIYSELKKDLDNNEELLNYINGQYEDGIHFDVITSVLSASVSFTLVNSSNQTIDINSELIEKINSDFNLNFTKSEQGNTVISGEELIIGIHYDPTMVKRLVSDLNM